MANSPRFPTPDSRFPRACFKSFPQDYDPPQPPLKKGGAIVKVPLF
ncbi:MAG: hypothetical protein F6K55_06565 [Moorea sp. SIO4A3]|nr:hypothetical protein [Moorena sp. SIO4A3]